MTHWVVRVGRNLFTLMVSNSLSHTPPFLPGLRETGFAQLAYADLFQLLCAFLYVVSTSSISPHTQTYFICRKDKNAHISVTAKEGGECVCVCVCVQGSLYKLICRELLLFLVVYILLGVIYRQLMSPAQKE